MKASFLIYRDGTLYNGQCVTGEECYALKDKVPPPWRTAVSTGVKFLLSNPQLPGVRLGVLNLGGSRYHAILRRESR